ncbi:GvpL/GvpF family gas vesicle protein [Streptomyces narbonensis]|uniref:GvpL/GvpF family gas vesicle protein n=1 Tax=Streptomyces narbonensis TaxID=67333 RepID=A0ABV3CJZ9_9ACTN
MPLQAHTWKPSTPLVGGREPHVNSARRPRFGHHDDSRWGVSCASARRSPRPPHSPREHRQRGDLVPAAEVGRFVSELGSLADAAPGVPIEVTGPWAPYSFAGDGRHHGLDGRQAPEGDSRRRRGRAG